MEAYPQLVEQAKTADELKELIERLEAVTPNGRTSSEWNRLVVNPLHRARARLRSIEDG